MEGNRSVRFRDIGTRWPIMRNERARRRRQAAIKRADRPAAGRRPAPVAPGHCRPLRPRQAGGRTDGRPATGNWQLALIKQIKVARPTLEGAASGPAASGPAPASYNDGRRQMGGPGRPARRRDAETGEREKTITFLAPARGRGPGRALLLADNQFASANLERPAAINLELAA